MTDFNDAEITSLYVSGAAALAHQTEEGNRECSR